MFYYKHQTLKVKFENQENQKNIQILLYKSISKQQKDFPSSNVQINNNQSMSFLCNQIFKTICPCFYSKKRDLSHYGDNQLIQRQQFIKEDTIDSDYDIKHKRQEHKKYEQSTQSSTLNSNRSQRQFLQEQNQFSNNSQNQNNAQSNSLTPQIQPEAVYHDYTDAITADHPYYDILYPKLEILSSLFQIDQKYRLDVPPAPFPLKMYCKQSQVRKTNIFVYSFQFSNTTYESYESLLNNFQLQKSFDSNINQYYKKVESPNNDTRVIYLSYNKVLIVHPRDFVYVRYVFKKGKQMWSVCTSIPNEEEVAGKVRGEIVLTATKVIQQQNKMLVNVYSEVNMKMGIKPQMAMTRGKTQIKKYLEKCHKYLNQNKNQSII